MPHVRAWLEAASIDVLALQETKVQDADFPYAEIAGWGYHVAYSGQKTYNGVAVLSRGMPVEEMSTEETAGLDPGQKRILAVSVGDIRVIDLYVVQGRAVGSEKYAYKLEWLKSVTAFVRQELARYRKLVVVGDFNVAPLDEDVHDPEKWDGAIMCSRAERAALREIQALGLTDTFRLFDQPAGEFSWWDYRGGGFRRNHGLRIDLILASQGMSLCCHRAFIDKEPRGWERPSDHAPVVAEFREIEVV